MQITPCPLAGLATVQLTLYQDDRGFFVERFNEARFCQLGEAAALPVHYVQDNHSRSAPGVLRGLHYQHEPAQGKLVGVVRGSIWDVAVDIRPESPTFGQHYSIELSDSNGLLLWIPAGFAHGFCVLGDEAADVVYKVTAPYSPANEGGIRYDDPELAIRWPLASPQLSPRDAALPGFAEYRENKLGNRG